MRTHRPRSSAAPSVATLRPIAEFPGWRVPARWAAVALLAGALLAPALAGAAPLVLDDVDEQVLESKSNGVSYRLWVRVPPGNWEEGRRFRVVVLLDADYSFLLARNITDHLTQRNHLEPLLLVGLGYAGEATPESYRLNRTRDYTPWHAADGGYGAEYQKASGGGPAFADFLAGELLPWLEQRYPALPDRTLVGHSYGGLFASWMLLARPEVFQRYIIVSPSLWYAGEKIFELLPSPAATGGGASEAAAGATSRAAQNAAARRRLRVSFGVGSRERNGDRDMPDLMQRFAQQLEERAASGYDVSSRVWQDETHNSIFPLALSTGLRAVHDGR